MSPPGQASVAARARDAGLAVGAYALAALFIAFIFVPLFALVAHLRPSTLLAAAHGTIVRQALWLSLETSTASLFIIALCGTPLAALLSQPIRGRAVLEALVTLPVVLPPVVGGLALLLAFGRAGLLGKELDALGIHIPFTTAAVVLAQTFVAAPLYISVARSVFSRVDADTLHAAAVLRASTAYTFARVIIPAAIPALLGGLALSWARALGEFGATITFAGSLPGVTQTMPVAVYMTTQIDLDAAIALAVILMVLSFGALLLVRAFGGRAESM